MYNKFRSWFTKKTCFAIYMSSSGKSNLTITVIFNSASIHPNHIRTSHFLLLVEHCQCSDKIILSKSVTSLFCANDQFRCRVSLNKSLVTLQLSPSDCFCPHYSYTFCLSFMMPKQIFNIAVKFAQAV